MASLLPGFKYDIFISYRQKDNKYDGWVTEFVANLKKELEATFKEDISIYFDENPHDGIMETHDVDRSLASKLKCLIYIPVLSQTFCDPKTFAWKHEFLTFIQLSAADQIGPHITLRNGNVTSRVLPVRIHELEADDINLLEQTLKGKLRAIDFVYKSIGVNRPLRATEDHPHDNQNRTYYRDQINKVANSIKEIITSLTKPENQKANLLSIETPARLGNEDIPKRDGQKLSETPAPKTVKSKYLKIGLPLLVLVLAAAFLSYKWMGGQRTKAYAKEKLIPEIQKLIDESQIIPTKTFDLAIEAESIIPGDSALLKLWPKISRVTNLNTEPQGASVYWKDYSDLKGPWKLLGQSPLISQKFPVNLVRVMIEKKGFTPITWAVSGYFLDQDENIKLDSLNTLPEKMVRVQGGKSASLPWDEGKLLHEFLLDKTEVSNKDFKRFVDGDGYQKKEYWKLPIYQNGREISWEKAIDQMVDKTGKSGPATWEVGSYPDGHENYPVTGVSWYEASAFAAFLSKQLPTVHHWTLVADTWDAREIVPHSNFNGKGTVPVGTTESMSTWGIYDLAGNVREWCENASDEKGDHYILGGAYNESSYIFNDPYAVDGFDRSSINGFRCMKELPGDSTIHGLKGETIMRPFRDYNKEKAVDDKTYNLYLQQFKYDRTALNPRIVQLADSGIWKIEKVTITAPYGREDLFAYLFLPRNFKPPYQTVVVFPGAGAIGAKDFQKSFSGSYFSEEVDFIVKSGRALLYPVLKGTFERSDPNGKDFSEDFETVLYRDHVVMQVKDISRCIDYLDTRNDLIHDKYGYFGLSWGAKMGGLVLAVEKRFGVAVLEVGGFTLFKTLPEVDVLNYSTRVKIPVLMLNGAYDFFFPLGASQKPMLRSFGTPDKDKKLISVEFSHFIPRQIRLKESLVWFDKYLGVVK